MIFLSSTFLILTEFFQVTATLNKICLHIAIYMYVEGNTPQFTGSFVNITKLEANGVTL